MDDAILMVSWSVSPSAIFTITVRNEVCEVAKVMFLHLSVILFTGGLGVCISACWDTAWSRHPGADTSQKQPPLEQTPPQSRYPPEQAPQGADLPMGADPPGADPPPSRWYASYWNAFLCLKIIDNRVYLELRFL